jgi:acyl carrier protein
MVYNNKLKMLRSFQRSLPRAQLLRLAQRSYYPDNILMKRVYGDYYADPMDVGERVVRLFALHDACRDPSNVTLNHTFTELGLNALDMVELFLVAEKEFNLEISEENCEEMQTVGDLVEFLTRSPATM